MTELLCVLQDASQAHQYRCAFLLRRNSLLRFFFAPFVLLLIVFHNFFNQRLVFGWNWMTVVPFMSFSSDSSSFTLFPIMEMRGF